MSRMHATLFALFFVLFSIPTSTHALLLSRVSDLISTSMPAAPASHTIQFTLSQDIPAGGHIIIRSDAGAFTLPALMALEDIAFSVASGAGDYASRAIAASPSATEDGVSIDADPANTITVTLKAGPGLSAGDKVRVVLDSTLLSHKPLNSLNTGSYRIRITTTDAAGGAIDYGTAMIAVVAPVSVSSDVVLYPPVRSNGLPTGAVPAGNTNIEISLNTDQLSTCRYSTDPGVSYGAMTHQFSPALGETFFTDLTGFQDNTTYTYYVRCISVQGVANTDDYAISFSLKPTPSTNTSIVTEGVNGGASSGGGGGGSGGVGDYLGGSAVLFLGSVSFAGMTVPGSTVAILKDGKVSARAIASGDGSFRAQITGLERGVYTFTLQATDTQGVLTGSDSETLNVLSGSANSITDLVLPPSMVVGDNTVAVGVPVRVSGMSVPSVRVEVAMTDQRGVLQTYAASSSASGTWTLTIPSERLSKGTYVMRARTVQSKNSISMYTAPFVLGVGGAPAASASVKNGDLNGDRKINLVDFSILLTQWGTSNVQSDLNGDGKINLADFSILLFNWTG